MSPVSDQPSSECGSQVLNLGSLNVDRVFRVSHLVRPGETIGSRSLREFAGGKGANQSIALARAGVRVAHCGSVGPDGQWLLETLAADGVDTRMISTSSLPTGQAMIQVADDGQNAIVLLGGANREITSAQIDAALDRCNASRVVLTQNETSGVPYLIEQASRRGFSVVFNPAPCTADVLDYPLTQVALLMLNESEGELISGSSSPEGMLTALRQRLPTIEVVLTLGSAGAIYAGHQGTIRVPAAPAQVVDTTAAGDTFIGYFLASRIAGMSIEQALRTACRAAAICVGRTGAIDSIPHRAEVSLD